jgi:hypothetical protein
MKTQDDFEGWVMFMDDAIDQAMGEVFPSTLAERLDFSLSSLSTLESWLIEQYESTAAFMDQTDNFVLDRISRYVGETIRRNGEGITWDINLDDESAAFHGLPLIKGASWTECPASLVTASLDRRNGNYIERIATQLVSGS